MRNWMIGSFCLLLLALQTLSSAPNNYCSWNDCDNFVAPFVEECHSSKEICENKCRGKYCQAILTKASGDHVWDCNGGGCDSNTLKPWNSRKYRYSPLYAPLDPKDYGGSVYGEKMWMTGAASHSLSYLLGNDDGCCGRDSYGVGGCGKCMLISNPSSEHPDWKVIVMKKNQCPPEATGCEIGKVHIDIAVPGFGNTGYDWNICGESGTYMTKQQSAVCGNWFRKGSSTTSGCDCSSIPYPLRKSCELFKSWGWKKVFPDLIIHKVVDCPAEYESIISKAFDRNGVTYQGGGNYCNWNGCNGHKQSNNDWCHASKSNCEGSCQGEYCDVKGSFYCGRDTCKGFPEGNSKCSES